DALDLAAVLEVADVLGLGHVQALALQHLGQLRLRFAALARGLLLLLLGPDALFLLALRADGERLSEIDVALDARSALASTSTGCGCAPALLPVPAARTRRAPARSTLVPRALAATPVAAGRRSG